MLRLKHVPILGVRLRLNGVVIKAGEMGYPTERSCALAGPVVSWGLGAVLLRIWPMCGLISLLLGTINLLPMLPLDGGRILRATLSLHLDCKQVDLVMRVCAFVIAGMLMLSACWTAVWLQAGVWPIFAALVLLWRSGETEK